MSNFPGGKNPFANFPGLQNPPAGNDFQAKSPWSVTPVGQASNAGGMAHVVVEREIGRNAAIGGHAGYQWAGPYPTRQMGAPYGGVHFKYNF